MKNFNDIEEDQIRIIGADSTSDSKPKPSKRWIIVTVAAVCVVAVVIAVVVAMLPDKRVDEPTEIEVAYFEPVVQPEPVVVKERLGSAVDSLERGFTEIRDTLINDIPLRIYIPHNAELSLHIGRMNKSDTSVIFTAQAADVRADNGGIVGAFVLAGEPRSWGLSKKGFCASINGEITIGVADNSPLFEKATEEGGYFFRQYPLVSNGVVMDNELKGKAIRRGICDRMGEIFMVETGSSESLHDFAQALADMGVDQAIYLVGSSAHGWAVDKEGVMHEFGDNNSYKGRRRMPRNTSYIVWKRR